MFVFSFLETPVLRFALLPNYLHVTYLLFLPHRIKTNNQSQQMEILQKSLQLQSFDPLFFRWIIPICFRSTAPELFSNCNLSSATLIKLFHSLSLLAFLYILGLSCYISIFTSGPYELWYDTLKESKLKHQTFCSLPCCEVMSCYSKVSSTTDRFT